MLIPTTIVRWPFWSSSNSSLTVSCDSDCIWRAGCTIYSGVRYCFYKFAQVLHTSQRWMAPMTLTFLKGVVVQKQDALKHHSSASHKRRAYERGNRSRYWKSCPKSWEMDITEQLTKYILRKHIQLKGTVKEAWKIGDCQLEATGSPPTILGTYIEGRYAVGQFRVMCNSKRQ